MQGPYVQKLSLSSDFLCQLGCCVGRLCSTLRPAFGAVRFAFSPPARPFLCAPLLGGCLVRVVLAGFLLWQGAPGWEWFAGGVSGC